MTLWCCICKADRVWTKLVVGTWKLLPGIWRPPCDWVTAPIWDCEQVKAIECPVCGTRREPKTLHLLPSRQDYYDF